MEESSLDSYEEWQLVGDTYFARRELYAEGWGAADAPADLAYMR